ncbi:EAL domain-containing protein [Elioraea sp.]|uniref:EAL domain-containing protein n=1 Tax=Elioraea sp. TaxID=2185103 RepID=UPI0025BD7514|nr:EAL domain-containing protein [Elioraea sp.]
MTGPAAPFPLAFSMAFQPIVDLETGMIAGHEALVRGSSGELAHTILGALSATDRPVFDHASRVKAIALAATLGLATRLSININAGAIADPDASLDATLAACMAHGITPDRLTFELVEDGRVFDRGFMQALIGAHRRHGIRTALDNFGAGFAGLGHLFDLCPDIVKLDMALVRGIDRDRQKRERLAAIVEACRGGFDLSAEGVESAGEFAVLRDLGVGFAQGYLIAKPAFERLVAEAELPDLAAPAAAEAA